MIGAPLTRPCVRNHRCRRAFGGRLRACGTPALQFLGSGHYRPVVTEFHQVVGGTLLLALNRQK